VLTVRGDSIRRLTTGHVVQNAPAFGPGGKQIAIVTVQCTKLGCSKAFCQIGVTFIDYLEVVNLPNGSLATRRRIGDSGIDDSDCGS
jgi:hypothetical protein